MITAETIRQTVESSVASLRARVSGLVVRGILKALDDVAGLQRVQVSARADEKLDDIEAITPHGFTSRPPTGSEVIVFSVGGDAAHRLALVFNRETRLKGELAEGEAALHIGVAGQMVRLKTNGDVVITPGEGGNVYLGQDGAMKRVALAEEVDDRLGKLQTAYDTHTHPTAAPGPVSTPTAVPGVSPVGALDSTAADGVYAKG